MEIDQDLLDKVKGSNDEFRKLYEEHSVLKMRVDELNKLRFLTPDQEIEKQTIKKKKLKNKDRMDEIIGQYQANLH